MQVTIYTDGAARGNPDGPGGYGAIVQYRDENGILMEKELRGGYARTTNNRMELMGVIAALEELSAFREACEGTLFSDSRYVVDAFSKRWIVNWQKNGWKTASGAPVKNQDLWNRLLKALEPHSIRFSWVKGHADHPENERCDRLATSAADEAGASFSTGDSAQSFEEESVWKKAGGKALDPDSGHFSTGKAKQLDPDAERQGPGNSAPDRLVTDRRGTGTSGTDALKIRIRYLSDRIDKLQPPDNMANWVDLRAAEDVELKKGDFRLIRLGVAMKLPEGYEAHIVPRSSTYKNFGIIQANHYGVIDNAYSGDGDEWMVPVIALRDTGIHINDRICQFRIEKRQPDIFFEEVDHLDDADRGGFGSTGIQ